MVTISTNLRSDTSLAPLHSKHRLIPAKFPTTMWPQSDVNTSYTDVFVITHLPRSMLTSRAGSFIKALHM